MKQVTPVIRPPTNSNENINYQLETMQIGIAGLYEMIQALSDKVDKRKVRSSKPTGFQRAY